MELSKWRTYHLTIIFIPHSAFSWTNEIIFCWNSFPFNDLELSFPTLIQVLIMYGMHFLKLLELCKNLVLVLMFALFIFVTDGTNKFNLCYVE
jgi:hypothetical protein